MYTPGGCLTPGASLHVWWGAPASSTPQSAHHSAAANLQLTCSSQVREKSAEAHVTKHPLSGSQ